MGAANGGYTRLEFKYSIPWSDRLSWRVHDRHKRKRYHEYCMFDGYAPYKGDIQYRKQGSLIAFETGESVTYGLFTAQERGTLFIGDR